ncbi:MAG: radical SAM protein [Acidobacteria bacterium]|nr:radical SAM protein [Acidobacteriota bacterium]
MRSESLLRLNRLVPSNRLKFLIVLAADVVGARHMIVRFDPIQACNLRCGMCYFSDHEWIERNPVKRFSKDEILRLADMFFPQAIQLHIGARTEPTVYKDYPSLVRLGKQYKIPFIGLTTNGQLLTRTNIRLLIEDGLDEITLSTHGIKKDTYEKMMRGASFETFHRNLKTIVDTKRELKKDNPAIRINYTVNPDNLSELYRFFDFFGNYDITTLQIRPIIDLGRTDYKNKSLVKHRQQYNCVIDFLISQCRRRGIFLLANKDDPGYERQNKFAVVYRIAVLRYIGPGEVWKKGYDFTSETYQKHKSHTGYRRELLRYVLKGDSSLVNNSFVASSQIF